MRCSRSSAEELLELGSGIVFVVGRESGRLRGVAAEVEQRSGWVITWEDARAVRVVASVDIDKARAVAARLARGPV